MTNQNLPPQEGAGADEHSNPISSSFSRRAVLQLAGGAASLAAISNSAAVTEELAETRATLAEPIRLVINGDPVELEIDPRQSLLDVLRETLHLTGTKKGCNQGACGACTILVDGKRIVSCLALVAMHGGAEVQTIEGLDKGVDLHPLQDAFIAHEGLQCGFCTPGQIMSGLGCIAEGHTGSPEEIQFWMSGNICRCGAYPGIVAAIAAAAERS